MVKITPEEAKLIIEKGFEEESISKFNKFLEERDQEKLYYEAVAHTANKNDHPVDHLKDKVTCAFEDESELGSCFVEFKTSKEGVDFWTKFNNDWQTYRKIN